jgi:hypothetical protein
MDILTGHPEDILPSLIRRIDLEVGSRLVSTFRIGRSSTPSARKSYYRFDKIISLYYSENDEDVEEVEHSLIDSFQDHEKCQNPIRNGGPISSEKGNYVYLGLWY